MSDGTKIEWTEATVNAVNGCSVISPGCANCYAMRLAGTRLRNHPSRAGLTIDSKAGPVWNGEIRVVDRAMREPLAWKRPRTIFWNAHGDLFHPAVPEVVIDRCFAVMALTPHHKHQVLTKRSAWMRSYIAGLVGMDPEERIKRFAGIATDLTRSPCAVGVFEDLEEVEQGWPLANVWLGVSVEDQQRADERIPDLLATPAAVRFLSCEPLLGPVDLTKVAAPEDEGDGWMFNALFEGGSCFEYKGSDGYWYDGDGPTHHGLNWVIVGGESGPGARPMHPAWAASLRDQCAAHGVPFLFKQWGEWAPVSAIDDSIETDDKLYHPMLEQHGPEGVRRCKVEQLVMQASGRIFPLDEWSRLSGENPAARDFAFAAGAGAMTMMKIGKRSAGRLLGNAQHDGMPA